MRQIFTTIFILFLSSQSAFSQARIYVNANVAGGQQTGETWADAVSDLQLAFDVASIGDTIWVAEGLYLPTSGTGRNASFYPKDGVQTYGGFAGTETSLAQRDYTAYPSILSGNIGDPALRTDNAYHVVTCIGLGSNTRLDGFVIRDGYSIDQTWPAQQIIGTGAGMLLLGSPLLQDSRPLIVNCRFEWNYAILGGGMAIKGRQVQTGEGYPVNPVLSNCEFYRNFASASGGGVYKLGRPESDTFLVADCRFVANFVYNSAEIYNSGAGVYLRGANNSTTIFRNCLFERDSAAFGAGVYLEGAKPDSSFFVLQFFDCIFRRNHGTGAGFYYLNFLIDLSKKQQFDCLVEGCIFEGNTVAASNGDGAAFYVYSAIQSIDNIVVKNTIFKNNLGNGFICRLRHDIKSTGTFKAERCIFLYNYDIGGDQDICHPIGNNSEDGGNRSITEVKNCLFANNGGAIISASGPDNMVTTQVTNCTFYNNNRYVFVKTWDPLFLQNDQYYNDFYLDNCVIWETESNNQIMFYNNNPNNITMYDYHFNHCSVTYPQTGGVPGSAAAFESGVIFGTYPMFVDTAGGDFSLQPCSPLINKGNNLAAENAGLALDIKDLPRIRYGNVDLGAYEQQDSCAATGVDETQLPTSLRVWPNPSAAGVLFFSASNCPLSVGIFQLVDETGRIVYSKTVDTVSASGLDLRFLPAGAYLATFKCGRAFYVGSWIKMEP